MKTGMAFRVSILAGWVVGILAPFYTFSRVSPAFRAAFNRVFQTQASHILMHMFLYAVLACLLASLFSRTKLAAGRLFAFVLMIAALVAVSQEALQMISANISFGLDEVFDFFVDMGGSLIGIGLYLILHRSQRASMMDIGGA